MKKVKEEYIEVDMQHVLEYYAKGFDLSKMGKVSTSPITGGPIFSSFIDTSKNKVIFKFRFSE